MLNISKSTPSPYMQSHFIISCQINNFPVYVIILQQAIFTFIDFLAENLLLNNVMKSGISLFGCPVQWPIRIQKGSIRSKNVPKTQCTAMVQVPWWYLLLAQLILFYVNYSQWNVSVPALTLKKIVRTVFHYLGVIPCQSLTFLVEWTVTHEGETSFELILAYFCYF